MAIQYIIVHTDNVTEDLFKDCGAASQYTRRSQAMDGTGLLLDANGQPSEGPFHLLGFTGETPASISALVSSGLTTIMDKEAAISAVAGVEWAGLGTIDGVVQYETTSV